MSDKRTYSTYEAKARFSEVIRSVREGRSIVVTYQGEPVAEIRPLGRSTGTAARIEWLRSRGVVQGSEAPRSELQSLVRRPGALDRFLEDRHR